MKLLIYTVILFQCGLLLASAGGLSGNSSGFLYAGGNDPQAKPLFSITNSTGERLEIGMPYRYPATQAFYGSWLGGKSLSYPNQRAYFASDENGTVLEILVRTLNDSDYHRIRLDTREMKKNASLKYNKNLNKFYME